MKKKKMFYADSTFWFVVILSGALFASLTTTFPWWNIPEALILGVVVSHIYRKLSK